MSRTVSVLIEGNYVDAYLYGGLLVAWDEHGRLVVVTTEAIARAAADESSSTVAAARAAFVDNKELRDRGARRRLEDSPLGRLRNGDGAIAHVTMESLSPTYFSVLTDATVLDLMATYGRLYVSTDESLVAIPFSSSHVGDLAHLLGIACFSSSPRWGAISASCGSKGAWALFNEVRGDQPRRAEQIDEDFSVRHGWLGTSLVSFSEDNQVDVFRPSLHRGQSKQWFLDGFSAVEPLDPYDVGDWLGAGSITEELRAADYASVVTGLVLIAGDGRLRALPAQTLAGLLRFVGDSRTYELLPGRVLTVADVEGGFVIETSTNLQYMDSEGTSVLIERDTIALRSYPRSRRHRRAVTATVDGGILISALLGDHVLPHAERYTWPPPAWW